MSFYSKLFVSSLDDPAASTYSGTSHAGDFTVDLSNKEIQFKNIQKIQLQSFSVEFMATHPTFNENITNFALTYDGTDYVMPIDNTRYYENPVDFCDYMNAVFLAQTGVAYSVFNWDGNLLRIYLNFDKAATILHDYDGNGWEKIGYVSGGLDDTILEGAVHVLRLTGMFNLARTTALYLEVSTGFNTTSTGSNIKNQNLLTMIPVKVYEAGQIINYVSPTDESIYAWQNSGTLGKLRLRILDSDYNVIQFTKGASSHYEFSLVPKVLDKDHDGIDDRAQVGGVRSVSLDD